MNFPFKVGSLIQYKCQDITTETFNKEEYAIRNRLIGNDELIRKLFLHIKEEPIVGLIINIKSIGSFNAGTTFSAFEKYPYTIWEVHLLIGEKEFYAYLSAQEAEEWLCVAG